VVTEFSRGLSYSVRLVGPVTSASTGTQVLWSRNDFYGGGYDSGVVGIPSQGVYRVIVTGAGDNVFTSATSGVRSIRAWKVPASVPVPVTLNGQTNSLGPTTQGEVVTRTFFAATGQRVVISTDLPNGALEYHVRLLSPKGEVLWSAGHWRGGPYFSDPVALPEPATVQTGPYRVVVEPYSPIPVTLNPQSLRTWLVGPDVQLTVPTGSVGLQEVSAVGQIARFNFHERITASSQISINVDMGGSYVARLVRPSDGRVVWEKINTGPLASPIIDAGVTPTAADPFVLVVDPIGTTTGPVSAFVTTVGYEIELRERLGGTADGLQLIADPVDTAFGNFYDAFADLAAPGGVSELSWGRVYNSRDIAGSPEFGPGYTSLLASNVTIDPNTNAAALTMGDGRVIRFTAIPGGGWVKSASDQITLAVRPTGGWVATADDQSTTVYDAAGRLVAITGWDGRTVTVNRDGTGRATALTHPSGAFVTFAYNATGRLSGATTSDGRIVTYGYTNDVLTSVTAPDGGVTTYTVDAQNRITKISDPAGKTVVENVFDTAGRVISQKNNAGAETTFSYNEAQRITVVRDVVSNTQVTFTHDTQGRVVNVADLSGVAKGVSYDSRGNSTGESNRDGTNASTTYDANDNPLTVTVPGQGTTTRTYDAQNRVLTEQSPWGATTTFAYTGTNRLPSTITDPAGKQTTMNVVNGRVMSTTDPDGVTTSYTYSSTGEILTVTNGLGRTWTYEYDAAGRKTKETTPLGFITRWTYDVNGRLLTIRAADGGLTTNTYDTSGRLLTVTDPTGALVTNAYDNAGRLLTVTEPGGAVTSYTYDAVGQVTKMTRPGGAEISTVYGEKGRVTQTRDAQNRPTTISYTADGRTNSVTNATGAASGTTYDQLGRVASSTDADGRVTTTTYDQYGRVQSITAPGNLTTTIGYDQVGRQATETDTRGAVTTTTYTDGGRVKTVTDPTGRVTTTNYDTIGRVASITAPGNLTTAFAYDLDDRRTSMTSPGGLVTSYQYDQAGRLTRTTMPDGVISTATYNLRGDVLTTKHGGEGTVSYAWNPNGTLQSVADPLGRITSFTYDGRRNLLSRTNALGGVDQWTYNNADQLLTQTDPLGRTTTTAYDANGRVSSVTDGAGRSWARGYTPAGLVASVAPQAGTQSTYAYDNAGRVASISRGADTTSYAYEPGGLPVSVTQPGGRVTRYGYDSAGRRTSMTTPDGTTLMYGYDPTGRLASIDAAHALADTFTGSSTSTADANKWTVTVAGGSSGAITDNRYVITNPNTASASTTLASKGVSAANVDVAMDYQFGDTTAANRQNIRVFARRSTTGSYRIDLRSDSTAGTISKTVGSTTTQIGTFNASNSTTPRTVRFQVTGSTVRVRTWAAGTAEPSGWDASVTDTGVTAAGDARVQVLRTSGTSIVTLDNVTVTNLGGPERIATYAYNADSQITTETMAGGTRTWGYTNGRITNLSSTIAGAPAATTLTYDTTGRLATEQVGTVTTRFGYDAASQLCFTTRGTVAATASCSTPPTGTNTAAWTYDQLGRRVTSRAGAATTRFGFDAASQMCWSTTATFTGTPTCAAPPSGATTYTWDGSGNLTGQTTGTDSTTYGYNPDGQLANVTNTVGATTTTQTRTYSPDQQLANVTTGTVTERIDWDGLDPAAIATNGATINLVDGAGPWAARRSGGTTTALVVDHLGNVRSTTATSGTARAATYDRWGVPSTAASANARLGYRGQLTIDGLTNMGARAYAAPLGTFTQTDPLPGVNGTTVVANPYHYANNSPTNLVDPTGLRPGSPALTDAIIRSELTKLGFDSAFLGGTVTGFSRPGSGSSCVGDDGKQAKGTDVIIWTTTSRCGVVGTECTNRWNAKWICEHADQIEKVLTVIAVVSASVATAGLLTGALGTGIGACVVTGAVTGAQDSLLAQAIGGDVNANAVARDASLGAGLGGLTCGAGTAITKLRNARKTASAPLSTATNTADDLAGAACRTNSFIPSTLVLMADGSTKPIEDIEVGDLVLATDPETGEQGPRRVTDLIVGEGLKELVEVEIDGEIIAATDGHPFWVDDEGAWVDAAELEAGDVLLVADGSTVSVDSVRKHVEARRVHNLTVDGIHTYFVVAGDESVLVHNCGGGMLGANGTQVTSKTLTPGNRAYRIDVENPAPGVRPGQVHLQDSAGGKYLYNFETGAFEGIPNSLARAIAKDPAVARAIEKGAVYLGLAG
jgi:RHS repeat-associated protein